MSLVFNLESDSGQTIPVPVHLNDTFQTFLSRASKVLEKDVNVSSIVGNKDVSLTDNIYQFMLREVLNNNSGKPSDIAHEIIHIPDYNALMEKCILESGDGRKDDVKKQAPKILNLEYYNKRDTQKTKDSKEKNAANSNNNKCCFCGVYISSTVFISYIFDENDQKEMRKSKHRRNRGAAKVVCDHCLGNDFIKYDEIPKSFDDDTYLIIRNNVQYFYKTKSPEKHRSVKILNSLNRNVDSVDEKLDVKRNSKGSYEITKRKFVLQQTVFYTCRLCKAVVDTLPISHCLDHVSSTSEGLVFPCVLCEYGYTSYKQLADHMSSRHSSHQTSETILPDSPSEKNDKVLKLLKELLKKQQEETRDEKWLDEDTGIMRKTMSVCENVDVPELDTSPSKESESDSESGVWIIQADDDDANVVDNDVIDLDNDVIDLDNDGGDLDNDVNDIDNDVNDTDNDVINVDNNVNDIDDTVNDADNGVDDIDNEVIDLDNDVNDSDNAVNGVDKDGDIDNGVINVDNDVKNVDNGVINVDNDVVDVDNGNNADEDDTIYYQCDTCSKEFDSMESFNCHGCVTQYLNSTSVFVLEYPQVEEEVKARVIAVTDGLEKETEVKESERTEEVGQHKCPSCTKSFHTKIRLQFHIRYIHSAGSDPASLRCSICPDLAFSSESALYDHIHFTHPRSKRYTCPVEGCNRQFHIKGVLNNHLGCHTGERTHACDVCEKQFFDRQTLNEHKVTHLKVKPFQCHICNKYLNRKSRLRMHLLNHQSHPASCPVLACKKCSATFPHANAAEEHLNELGHCTSKLCWDTSGLQEDDVTEESVDDPDVVESSLNDSGIDLKSGADLNTDVKQEPCTLFEDVKMEGENTGVDRSSKNDEESVETNGSNNGWSDILAGLSEDARKSITLVEVDKVFRCEFCEKIYWRQEALNIHRSEHKGIVNPYVCHICGAQFSTYSRCTTHKTTHGLYKVEQMVPHEDAFPVIKHFLCEVCNKSYLHWTYLQVHRRLKHSDNVHMYKCLTCGDEFPNSWGVAYHRKKIHGQSSGSAPADEVPDTNVERIQYSCPDCGIIVSTKAQLFLHKRATHPNPPSPPKADLFACSRCNKRYITKAGLQGHIKKQHEKSTTNQIQKCNECDKTFINVSGLNTHVRRVHKKEIKFRCTECGVGFYSSCDLRSHVRRHSGERPYPCHVCGKYFRTKGMRNQHVRIHSGERPFKCDICGVGFRRSYALRSHRLTHAPHTRSIPCPICPRLFRLKAELNTHMRHVHCVDPLTYTTNSSSSQKESEKNIIPKTTNNEVTKVTVDENITHSVDDVSNEKTLVLNVHQNSNVDSCLFTTYFEDGQHNFMDNMEEVQMSDPVFNQSNHREITHSDKVVTGDNVMASTSHQLEDTPSNNLCIISEQNLAGGEIILDGNNMLPNSQYILDENVQIIGELSEQSRNLLFRENAGHNRVLEINGYHTRLVMLNNVVDINDIKLVNIDNDLINKQVDELTNDNLNDLYGSNVVIDKVSINADMSIDDDVIDRGGSFVIDWQENEDVASNEKSLDNCKYFSDA